MFASGVDGDTTAVFSDVLALEEAADALPRFCARSQRAGSATVDQRSAYKLLEVGRYMYDRWRCLVRV